MISVLDACAIVAYLSDEPGAALVESLLADSGHPCYDHALNLCENCYHFVRLRGIQPAQLLLDELKAVGLVIREDFDRDFLERVGEQKARGRISLADCVCPALAQFVGGQVVTSDHGEFDPIAEAGICPILFIR